MLCMWLGAARAEHHAGQQAVCERGIMAPPWNMITAPLAEGGDEGCQAVSLLVSDDCGPAQRDV